MICLHVFACNNIQVLYSRYPRIRQTFLNKLNFCQLFCIINVVIGILTQSVNYDNKKLLSSVVYKEGHMGNCNSSPTCTFDSHCVYEHVPSTDTEVGEYEVM